MNDAAEARIKTIPRTIGECMIGIHDISRTELDAVNQLPRFDMPLELGIHLGARYYGSRKHRGKACLVVDRERYRYQNFTSDIAGQDVSTHDDDAEQCIGVVRDVLNDHNGSAPYPRATCSLRSTPGSKQFFRRSAPTPKRTRTSSSSPTSSTSSSTTCWRTRSQPLRHKAV